MTMAVFPALTLFASPAQAATQRFAANSGVSTGGGYYWYHQGPDQADDSTNFGASMKWKLQYSDAGIYNAESYVSGAVAAVNAQSPGIPQVWGGNTTNTAVPTCYQCTSYEDAWLIRMVPTAGFQTKCGTGANTLGCAVPVLWNVGGVTNAQGCIIWINSDKYKAGGSYWAGVFRHEMGHCLGLAHNDLTYLGVKQLMNSVITQNNFQQGDGNGIRAVTRRV
ncbi:MAG TPA: hypothetical protein VNQ77_11795 [Frankiaceae bacterium]|nr:hypothetical protein [Frankiaceae bacterium]